MSSSSGASRVSIPANVRKTIHDIREITGKQHSDDEIYAVLRECSMDPNETAQKLLYLDTFHEVKSRRDRKKENFNGKAAEERATTGMQRRGSRGGGQGNYASNFSSDAGGGKNAARRENGALPFSHRARNNAGSRAARPSTALPNGSATLSNGYASKPLVDSEGQLLPDVSKSVPPSNEAVIGATSVNIEQEKSSSNSEQSSTPFTLPLSDVHSSVDSLSAPSLVVHSDVSTVDNDGGSQQLGAEHNHLNENNTLSGNNVGLGKSESDEAEHVAVKLGLEEKIPSKPRALESSNEDISDIVAEVRALSTAESGVSNVQHVTFPNHFQVPEALKSGLTFGSFDVAFGQRAESVSVSIENEDAAETCEDGLETSKESSPSDQNATAIVKGAFLDNSQSLTRGLATLQPSESHATSTDSKDEQPKQEAHFLPEGTQNQPIITPVANYSLGLIPNMVGNQIVPYEGIETQAHEARVPIFANGNSFVPPSTNPSPPLPSSIAVSPQPVPVFRHTYPPNFFPYGQYISPFYIPPMHQYLGHNGFAPQPTTGNVYLPPGAAAAGVKFALPQFKPGNNVGNPTHIGMQPAGSYISAPVGYGQPVTSGSSISNDEIMASHMKENQIYTTGQLTEGSGVWVHAGGQEMPGLQMNSVYNLPHQAHIAFSPQQSAHGGAFAGMFPPGHGMTAPSTLVQQSQAVAGAIEAIGPPTGAAYQQPQHAQINWNAAF